ncbi:MAG TPA: phosphotransacetylase family protein [Armatimonadota bacterium]|nr:phosphotransacetylase family protein [Armatimonadota bacterium]
MVTLYIGSSEPYSGKTLTSIVLGTRWQRQGKRVGYMKPLGLLAVMAGTEVADEDAQFVAQQLNLDTPPSDLCPILMNRETCSIAPEQAERTVRKAFEAASAGVDVMIVSGTGPVLSRGSMLGLSGVRTAEMLGAKVLLIGRCESFLDADSILAASHALGERAVGAILNLVPPRLKDQIWDDVVPCLERSGLKIFGLMPKDPILHSVSVRELAEATAGEFLCCAESADALVENFIVGAMGVERALRYFRRTPRKCVITGGDRSDIQLAALETPTRCIILTGDLRPSHTVLARAEELGVPVLLVREDTLATVTMIDEILSKLRVREPKKIQHAVEQFEAHLELAKLDEALGLD